MFPNYNVSIWCASRTLFLNRYAEYLMRLGRHIWLEGVAEPVVMDRVLADYEAVRPALVRGPAQPLTRPTDADARNEPLDPGSPPALEPPCGLHDAAVVAAGCDERHVRDRKSVV